MITEMIWKQHMPDFTNVVESSYWECEVNENLIYRIKQTVEDISNYDAKCYEAKCYEAIVGTRTNRSNGFEIKWTTISSKKHLIEEALNACASDYAIQTIKHSVQNVKEILPTGTAKYEMLDFRYKP